MVTHLKKRAQITIPLKVCKAVGIAEGDMLDIIVRDNEIVLKPLKHRKTQLKPVDVSILDELTGVFSIGGDAVKDTDNLYDYR